MISPIIGCVAGLDVHKDMLLCTIIRENSTGELIKETKEYKTFRKNLKEFSEWLKNSKVELAVMESTGIYWKQVYEVLEEDDIKAYIVNARHIKNVPGRKSDVMDSEWLAELARCGLLKPSFVPPKDLRELRLLTRYRKKLADILGSEKNRLHKMLESAGIKLSSVVSDIDGVSARNMIEALLEKREPKEIIKLAIGRLKKKNLELIEVFQNCIISDPCQFLLERLLGHMKWLESQLSEVDKEIVTAMEPYKKEWGILQTIPGIDEISAAMLLAETGIDMSVFRNKESISSWSGMCPGNNESAGKKKSGRIRRGNKYIRTILCEVSNSARKTNSQFKGLYNGLVIRRGHKRAIVALGHKIIEIMYVLLKKKEPYRDPGINYEELMVEKNAPRWIKALEKYGYLNN